MKKKKKGFIRAKGEIYSTSSEQYGTSYRSVEEIGVETEQIIAAELTGILVERVVA